MSNDLGRSSSKGTSNESCHDPDPRAASFATRNKQTDDKDETIESISGDQVPNSGNMGNVSSNDEDSFVPSNKNDDDSIVSEAIPTSDNEEEDDNDDDEIEVVEGGNKKDKTSMITPTKEKKQVKVDEETLAHYEEEKQLMKILSSPPPGIFKKNIATTLWGTIQHINWRKMLEWRSKMEESGELDNFLIKYNGIAQVLDVLSQASEKEIKSHHFFSIAKRLVVCPKCFNNATASLFESLIQCGTRGSTSNISQHWKKVHKDEPPPSTGKESTASASVVSRQSSLLFATQGTTSKSAHSAIQHAIFRCINDLGFPTNTCEKEPFREMLITIADNARYIKGQETFKMSAKAVTRARIESYNHFIGMVAGLGMRVRNHYNKLCGRDIRFATICHDIWQGIKKDILGVTIMFCDPRNCQIYKIPIGLIPAHGHKAAQVCQLTTDLMLAYGFSSSDLCASVNDNTNGAILAGKYITGMQHGGKCDMHTAELIMKHATGMAVRKRNKVIVDSNPAFMVIYHKFYLFSSWLMSKQSRSRFINFPNASKQQGMKVIEIPMPNETHVGGCLIMFQGLIRNKWAFDAYASRSFGVDKEFKKRYPKQEEWDIMSEYESILRPLQQCSMSLQSDEPGSSCSSLLQIYFSQYKIKQMRNNGLRVLSMKAEVWQHNNDTSQLWDAKATMKVLELKKTRVAFADLHPQSRHLVHRLLKEYDAYFQQHNDIDAEKAMLSHPILVGYMPTFLQFLHIYSLDDVQRIKKQFIEDMVDKLSRPASAIGAAFANQDAQNNQNGGENNNGDRNGSILQAAEAVVGCNIEEEDLEDDPFEQYDQQQNMIQNAMQGITGEANNAGHEQRLHDELKRECKEAYEDYARYCSREMINTKWPGIIEEFPTESYVTESPKWSSDEWATFHYNCKKRNYLLLAKYFNVMEWWRRNEDTFPKVFPSALVWITKPSTNAFQERVFSKSSWFDSNRLMRSQSGKTFEMRTMESLTRRIRDNIVDNEKIIQRSRQRRKVLLRKLKRRSGENVPNVPYEEEESLEDVTPLVVDVTKEHIIDLTRKLDDYNSNVDPTMEGPEATFPKCNNYQWNLHEEGAEEQQVLDQNNEQETQDAVQQRAEARNDNPPDEVVIFSIRDFSQVVATKNDGDNDSVTSTNTELIMKQLADGKKIIDMWEDGDDDMTTIAGLPRKDENTDDREAEADDDSFMLQTLRDKGRTNHNQSGKKRTCSNNEIEINHDEDDGEDENGKDYYDDRKLPAKKKSRPHIEEDQDNAGDVDYQNCHQPTRVSHQGLATSGIIREQGIPKNRTIPFIPFARAGGTVPDKDEGSSAKNKTRGGTDSTSPDKNKSKNDGMTGTAAARKNQKGKGSAVGGKKKGKKQATRKSPPRKAKDKK